MITTEAYKGLQPPTISVSDGDFIPDSKAILFSFRQTGKLCLVVFKRLDENVDI